MADRIYILTVDSTDPAYDIRGLKEHIKNSSYIKNWWHHIPSVFLLNTDLDADAISERLKPFTGGANFLVMEVNPEESERWLPERSWKWIQRYSRRVAPLTKAS